MERKRSAYEKLLSLSGKQLEVIGVKAFGDNEPMLVSVQYANCSVKDYKLSPFLTFYSGLGITFEEACEDYLNKISGKVLVFETLSGDRETVIVL